MKKRNSHSVDVDYQKFDESVLVVKETGYLSAHAYLAHYRQGYFVEEMPDGRGFEICEAAYREVIKVQDRSLSPHVLKSIRKSEFSCSIDQRFDEVVYACSRPHAAEDDKWMRDGMRGILSELHTINVAHSIEIYQSKQLCGGLVGFKEGGMFFGLSLFHTVSGASKAALAVLKTVLNECGVGLLDCREPSALTRSFGSQTISSNEFWKLRSVALEQDAELLPRSGIVPVRAYIDPIASLPNATLAQLRTPGPIPHP